MRVLVSTVRIVRYVFILFSMIRGCRGSVKRQIDLCDICHPYPGQMNRIDPIWRKALTHRSEYGIVYHNVDLLRNFI